MIRKQILLTEDLERRIRLRAHATRRAEARVIRELLEAALRRDGFAATVDAALAKVDRLATAHRRTAPPDLSGRVDDYLYGTDAA
jgi:hypothetical protein